MGRFRSKIPSLFAQSQEDIWKTKECAAAQLTWNITGLLRKYVDCGILLGVLLYKIDKILERGTVSLAKVEDFIIVRSINSTDNTINNVVDVRIIARGRPITELLNRLSTGDSVNEDEGSHVRTTTLRNIEKGRGATINK